MKDTSFMAHSHTIDLFHLKSFPSTDPFHAFFNNPLGNITCWPGRLPAPTDRAAMHGVDKMSLDFLHTGDLIAEFIKSLSHRFQADLHLGIEGDSFKG